MGRAMKMETESSDEQGQDDTVGVSIDTVKVRTIPSGDL